ncbi:hypothetical protein AUB43_14240, partial [Salmonella enterica subsp. enterica serovar Typhimurium var. 5-]|nr:hypothetical protein [Salmonella enterica]EAB7802690.1 hypothetical protein [Salmonella enterica subsp. enterica serovar Heidelberg]EBR9933864.1 hypothetical protein [Salmonella enterica subsp. enterica serovar Infantis]EBV8666987.1 hypothetical protein [Salmonella enterica subsp. enterica serovar Typhimurium var. 5-]EBW8777860.1 hypothetical protein [Salmonella enterica subsp. enterica serovar 4,12:i:-]ECC3574060.1 hypothetical protein [Salmonella enterica subsp. enterica]
VNLVVNPCWIIILIVYHTIIKVTVFSFIILHSLTISANIDREVVSGYLQIFTILIIRLV